MDVIIPVLAMRRLFAIPWERWASRMRRIDLSPHRVDGSGCEEALPIMQILPILCFLSNVRVEHR